MTIDSPGQWPRSRLVGETLHLPAERKHGRSEPLNAHRQKTSGWGVGVALPPAPLPPGEGPPEGCQRRF
jgi:hypothetical protein